MARARARAKKRSTRKAGACKFTRKSAAMRGGRLRAGCRRVKGGAILCCRKKATRKRR